MAQFKLTASDYAAMADMSDTDRQLYLDDVVYPRAYADKLGWRAAMPSYEDIAFQGRWQDFRDDFLAAPAESYVPARAA